MGAQSCGHFPCFDNGGIGLSEGVRACKFWIGVKGWRPALALDERTGMKDMMN
jgi:hypothetical protein